MKDLGFWEIVPKTISPTHGFSWQDASAMYRCEALSIEGFIQQLAVCYVGRGYFFCVTGVIPEGKDPRAVDEKLLRQYHIAVSKWRKWRGFHLIGEAKLQYLRFERFMVILATEGGHQFLKRERHAIRDARNKPRQSFRYAGGELTRPYLVEISLTSSQGRIAAE
jgi:hypothetical protein